MAKIAELDMLNSILSEQMRAYFRYGAFGNQVCFRDFG